MNSSWHDDDIFFYYLGIKHSEYPNIIWNRIKNENVKFTSVLDIGSGPGAFALSALQEDYKVQAVDICEKHLTTLENMTLKKNNLKTYNNDWLDASIQKADISVCAYCLNGSIKSLDGITKVINNTRLAAYFISFSNEEKTDFMTEQLFRKSGIKPVKYSSSNDELVDILNKYFGNVIVENLTYDFGVPYINTVPIEKYAEFISRKTGINNIALIIKHIENIVTSKDGNLWLPNPKESLLITWRNNHE